MYKYTVYDNNNKKVYETDDIFLLNIEIEINFPLGEFLHIHRENNIFIMYFENYIIFEKM